MGEPTLKEKITDWVLTPLRYLEFRLAMRWLNREFGYKEFWGDAIWEGFVKAEKLKEFEEMNKKQI